VKISTEHRDALNEALDETAGYEGDVYVFDVKHIEILRSAVIAMLEDDEQTTTVAPAVDAQPVAWMVLAANTRKPCEVTLHKSETEALRQDCVIPLYASAQSEGLRKLDAPAQVAGTVFRSGISWETVIKAAQRNYRYRDDPATNDYPDTFTLEQIQAMDKIIPQCDREFVGLKDYQALANEFAALSQKESGE
jgi:hypothetical protein